MSERTNTSTPRTNEAISQAMINNPYSMVKSMKECRDAWQFMAAKLEDCSEQLERELQGFCKVLGCTGLTPSGNVVAAMQKLLEMQRDLAAVAAPQNDPAERDEQAFVQLLRR